MKSSLWFSVFACHSRQFRGQWFVLWPHFHMDRKRVANFAVCSAFYLLLGWSGDSQTSCNARPETRSSTHIFWKVEGQLIRIEHPKSGALPDPLFHFFPFNSPLWKMWFSPGELQLQEKSYSYRRKVLAQMFMTSTWYPSLQIPSDSNYVLT